MKRWMILMMLILSLMAAGCSQNETAVEAAEQSRQEVYKQDWVKARLTYAKDERTGLCFAIYDDGAAGRGPTMVLVDPTSVPDSLATIISR